MSGAYQRTKGAGGEREAAKAIAAHLGLPMERGARNGIPGAPDLIGWPDVHVEVKRRTAITAARWLDQAIGDASAHDGCRPVVVMREDRGEWMVLMRLEDLPDIAQDLVEMKREGGAEHERGR